MRHLADLKPGVLMISHPTAHWLGVEAPYWNFYSVNQGKGVTYLMSLNIKRACLLGPFWVHL